MDLCKINSQRHWKQTHERGHTTTPHKSRRGPQRLNAAATTIKQQLGVMALWVMETRGVGKSCEREVVKKGIIRIWWLKVLEKEVVKKTWVDMLVREVCSERAWVWNEGSAKWHKNGDLIKSGNCLGARLTLQNRALISLMYMHAYAGKHSNDSYYNDTLIETMIERLDECMELASIIKITRHAYKNRRNLNKYFGIFI